MRAVLSEVVGGPATLVVREVPDPEPGPGAVLVDIHAAAVNFPDLLLIEDKYQIKLARPFIPGGEAAGVVRAVGAGVTGLKAGDHVIAAVTSGGFAERAAVPAERCYRIPERMPFDAASCLLFAYGTAYHALVDRAALRPGERVLVLGAAGGVGVAAIQVARALGARVFAAARGEEKLAFCRAQGAEAAVDYGGGDLKARFKELGGIDVVFDNVGGDYSEPALRALRPFGRFLTIGYTSGTIPRLPLNLVLLKECSVVGVQWGVWAQREPAAQAREVGALLALWEKGALNPHVHARYALARAGEALQALASRRVLGKVVVVPE